MKLYKSKELRKNEVEVLFWNFITEKYHEDAEIYHAPVDGGYVKNSNGTQICEGLGHSGVTLKWNGKGKFIDFMRIEFRKWSKECRGIYNGNSIK